MNELHEKVFNTLEEYRQKHPDLIYLTRTDKNKDKLNAGMWMLGDKNYAWVSWIKRSFNMNHSPALRLLLKKNINGISCTVENGYKLEVEPEVINFYSQARAIIAKDYKKMTQKKETFFDLILDQKEGLEAMVKFLDVTKPKLDSLVNKMTLEKILFSKEEFDQRLNNIKVVRETLNNNPITQNSSRNFWLIAPGQRANMWDEFFKKGIMAIGWDTGDLLQYDSQIEVEKRLASKYDPDKDHGINAQQCFEFSHEIRLNDIVIAKRGMSEYLGWGVVSEEYSFHPENIDFQHEIKVDWKGNGSWQGEIQQRKTVSNITNNPKLKSVLKLLQIPVENGKSLFQKYREQYHPETFEKYTQLTREIVKNLNLEIDSKKIRFSLQPSARLNFIVGRRFCLCMSIKKKNVIFNFISTDKLPITSSSFNRPTAYYNTTESILDIENNKQIIEAECKEELVRTTISKHPDVDDAEFRSFIFQQPI